MSAARISQRPIELARLKRTAFLINTSRGPIVDEAALVTALREQRIAGAGLDVFDTEPLPKDHPRRTVVKWMCCFKYS